MKFTRRPAAVPAILTGALLAASAARSVADNSLFVFARVGETNWKYNDGTRGEDALSDWAFIKGKFGNSALSAASVFPYAGSESLGCGTSIRLAVDAGPFFWQEYFPAISENTAEASCMISREDIVTFTRETCFQMNASLWDAAKLTQSGWFRITITEEPSGRIRNPLYQYDMERGGMMTATGKLPAGTYKIESHVHAETLSVGPNYTNTSLESAGGMVETSVHFSFLDKLTPAFLEWSRELGAFNADANRLRIKSDRLRDLLTAQKYMLALTREYKPSGFDTDFHVIARPGVKGSHSIVPADAARAARHADAVKSLVRDYKRYRDVHEDLQRMVAAAVDKGHLPAYALLELATRVPRLPSAINKHLAAVSFFKKDRHYTTAEVELLRMRYDAAAGWLGKNRPVLNKRIKSLRHDHIFMAEAIQTASKDYTKAMDADTRLSSRESYVLQAQLTLGSWAWRPND